MLVLLYCTLAVASETATTSCKLCYSAILREVLRTIWTTFETAVRGFLLGFGAAILKDLLVDKKGVVPPVDHSKEGDRSERRESMIFP